jgi:hypothetical protein
MDVSYVKKTKDPKYFLEYMLTNDTNHKALFNDEDLKSGELKNFIQSVSSFNLHYDIKTDYTRYENF